MKELHLILAIGCAAALMVQPIRGGEPASTSAAEFRESLMIERQQQILPAAGKSVRVKGSYVVTKIGPHRIMEELPDGTLRSSDRSVSVELADGARISLGPRPEKEMVELEGKTVIATGVLYLPVRLEDSKAAQTDPAPTLVQILGVVLMEDRRSLIHAGD